MDYDPAKPSETVRKTCTFVMERSDNVHVDYVAVDAVARALRIEGSSEPALQEETLAASALAPLSLVPASWRCETHYFDDSTPEAIERTARYILVLDAINFCFWPDPRWEYADFSGRLKRTFVDRPELTTPKALADADVSLVKQLFGGEPPLISARVAALREIGSGLLRKWDGSVVKLIEAAGRSSQRLVSLMKETFPMFVDTALMPFFRDGSATSWAPTDPPLPSPEEGSFSGDSTEPPVPIDVAHVWLLKRAQIFAADVWGAFDGKGLGEFDDIAQITTFADYRVPQTLRHIGVLRLSVELARRVERGEYLPAGSRDEVELRAGTVVAVAALTAAIRRERAADIATAANGTPGAMSDLCDVLVDWWLWQNGEAARTSIPPFHRTVTTNY